MTIDLKSMTFPTDISQIERFSHVIKTNIGLHEFSLKDQTTYPIMITKNVEYNDKPKFNIL
jgi:hypothetical protein